MNFYQRKKENIKYLKKYGCVVCSVLFQAHKMLDLDWWKDITLNKWYKIFLDKHLFTKDGYFVWYRISRVFPQIEVETYLWNGRHKDLDLIDDNSIISVDYKRDPKYKNSHFAAVTEKEDDNIMIYNSYYDTEECISSRYLIDDSLKDSIFSIVNLQKK